MTKPDAWTLSPQMTAAPELWRGVLFALPVWEGNADPKYIVLPSTDYTIFSAGTWMKNGSGAAITGTIKHRMDSLFNVPALDEATILVHGRCISTGGDRTLVHLTQSQTSSVSDNGFALFRADSVFGEDETDTFLFRVEEDGSVDRVWTPTGVGNTTEIITLVARWKSGSLADLTVNGIEYNSNTSLSMTDSVSPGNYNWFSFNGFADGSASDSETGLAVLWDRYLSDGDKELLANDPFAMLRPAGF